MTTSLRFVVDRRSLSETIVGALSRREVGHRDQKRALRAEIYAAAKRSIGVPVPLESPAMAMFRLVLQLYLILHQLRERIGEQAALLLVGNSDSRRLMTMPGIGTANT
jgi:hypothetical protein